MTVRNQILAALCLSVACGKEPAVPAQAPTGQAQAAPVAKEAPDVVTAKSSVAADAPGVVTSTQVQQAEPVPQPIAEKKVDNCAAFQAAHAAWVNDDDVEGRHQSDLACKQGCARGCLMQAYYELSGRGGPADICAANDRSSQNTETVRSECSAGIGDACEVLGLVIRSGPNAKKMKDEIGSLYRRGCSAGSATACLDYAEVTGDQSERKTYYQKACEGDSKLCWMKHRETPNTVAAKVAFVQGCNEPVSDIFACEFACERGDKASCTRSKDLKLHQRDAAVSYGIAPKPEYAVLSGRDYQKVVKDPSEHIGEAMKIFGKVTQFDSATGSDMFRASTGSKKAGSFYGYVSYDHNTMLTGCKALFADVVENDLFEAKVRVIGSYDYSNSMGGGNSCPKLVVDEIKVYGHAK